jgi:hypothetical protein
MTTTAISDDDGLSAVKSKAEQPKRDAHSEITGRVSGDQRDVAEEVRHFTS